MNNYVYINTGIAPPTASLRQMTALKMENVQLGAELEELREVL